MAQNLYLTVLANKCAVCQFEVSKGIPEWAKVNQPFGSVTYTPDEISVVLPQEALPEKFRKCEKGWRILKIEGILEFTLCGIIFSIPCLSLADTKSTGAWDKNLNLFLIYLVYVFMFLSAIRSHLFTTITIPLAACWI